MAEEKGIPVLGQLPIKEEIRENGDKGSPTAINDDELGTAFRGLARNLAQQVAVRNASKQQTEAVEITRT